MGDIVREYMENTMKAGVTQPKTLASDKGSMKMAVAEKWKAEIDTSAPFESVKEAIDRFGGSAVWKSQPKPHFNTGKHHSVEEIEFINVQEQSIQLKKDLITKEQETLKILSELETTKKIINCLESRLHDESSEANKLPESLSETVKQSPGSILFDLKQAKMNLIRTRSYLADIRASIESFTIKIDEEKSLLEKNHKKLSSKLSAVSFLEEDLKHLTLKLQLTKETEAAKSEVLRLTSEIEQLTATIKAAKVAQSKVRSSVIALSIEEYTLLTRQVQEVDESSSKKIKGALVEVERANQSKLELMAKIEEAVEDVKTSRKVLEDALIRAEAANRRKHAVEQALRKLRSEHCSRLLDQRLNLLTDDSRIERKHTLSIGEILSRKLMGPDDFAYDLGICYATKRDKATVSLGQLINRRSRILSCQNGGGSTKGKIMSMMNKTDFCSNLVLD